MKYAKFGTVSHGTLRTEDLLSAFRLALEDLVQNNAEEWCSDEGRKKRDIYLSIIKDAEEADPESETAEYLVNELLIDALNEFAPVYLYFGTHEGDGSDFGFWLCQEALDCNFEGIRVKHLSQVPSTYDGEVLLVNGCNMTLYQSIDGKLSEIWAIV